MKTNHQLRARCLAPTMELLQGQKYLHIERGGSVLGVAHCDYVDSKIGDKWAQSGSIVKNTRLDDRLGVHILLDLLPQRGIITDILLTDDEEIGQSTAELFRTEKQYNWIFQFDRRGVDCVHYDFDCMAPYIESHFTLGQGSFSDICSLEHLGIGGMNIGTGYYNEHRPDAFCDLKETYAQVNKFAKFFHEFKDTKIIHTPKPKIGYLDGYGASSFYSTSRQDDYLPDLSYGAEDLDAAAKLLGYEDFVDVIVSHEFATTALAVEWVETAIWELQRGYAKQWDKEGGEDICLGY